MEPRQNVAVEHPVRGDPSSVRRQEVYLQKRLRLLAIAVTLTAAAAITNGPARASMIGQPLGLGLNVDAMPPLEDAQFVWGGRRYCWYFDAWRGPGWYRCGYSWRRGLGWGGASGWHGWHRPPHRRPGVHRPGRPPSGVHRPGRPPSGAHRPGGNRPGVSRPGGGRPGVSRPGGGRPGGSAGGRPGGGGGGGRPSR